MLRVLFIFLVGVSYSCIAEVANGNGAGTGVSNKIFIEGKHYKLLEEPFNKMAAPVVEFFYYGCKTCANLAPVVSEWSFESKTGVAVVPVHSEHSMADEARLFHTFEELGLLNKMYESGYVITQTDSNKLRGEARMDGYMKEYNLDKEKFWKAWNSNAVASRMAVSAALTKQAQISRTPTFIIHGVYKVDGDSVASVEELFELLEFLVNKEPKAVPTLLKRAN